jgi:hypothetical protein
MPNSNDDSKNGVISGRVIHASEPIRDAEVRLFSERDKAKPREMVQWTKTNEEGEFSFQPVPTGEYCVECTAFGIGNDVHVKIRPDCLHPNDVIVRLPLDIRVTAFLPEGENWRQVPHLYINRPCIMRLETAIRDEYLSDYIYVPEEGGATFYEAVGRDAQVRVFRPGLHNFRLQIVDAKSGENSGTRAKTSVRVSMNALEPESTYVTGEVGVQLKRTRVDNTPDQALWSAIRLHTRRIGFGPYQEFINRLLCGKSSESLGNICVDELVKELRDPDKSLHGVRAYDVLRYATEAFLLRNCGVKVDAHDDDRRLFNREFESARMGEPVTFEFVQYKLKEYLGSPPQLPYITRVINDAFPWDAREREQDNVLTCRRLNQPCLIELIWSYWHEEGMLAQTMNAVARRFQNLRSHHRDALANLEIDPLRPLNNILWGFIQDEFRRLTVKRRAYEYNHEYGLTLFGKGLSHIHPADSRSKFIEAFHNLLHLCAVFFKEDNDTTVIADGYPLLHALKEVHLLLAQGAQNQFGDLPWTARAEMLLQQWMLARPEIRDFLQSRAMVPYKEPWMPQVDTMKTLQAWSDVTVTHFRDLGVYGEQILLSVRYGDWMGINDEDSAKNWARYWRPEIQGYLHAYRAATGIDLTHSDTVDATLPSVHLQNRLAAQQQRLR